MSVRKNTPEQLITNLDFKKSIIDTALPSHFNVDYPTFVTFLETYYEYLQQDDGFTDLIEQLRNVRNPDWIESDLIDSLKYEYGARNKFPDQGALDDATLVKILLYWFRSKGSKEAVEAYFRLFLNVEDVEVIYPKENMLRASDGDWSASESRFTSNKGKLSESSMVLQDSYYYQLYSYVVRAGVSFTDWGPTFTKLAHPAGWELFGEVEIRGFAAFEVGLYSPTEVPGWQTGETPKLVITGAATKTYTTPQLDILKTFDEFAPPWTGSRSMEDIARNLYTSTFTVDELSQFTVDDFTNNIQTSVRPTARITLS